MTELKLPSYTLKSDIGGIFGIPDPKFVYKLGFCKSTSNFDYIHKIVLKTRKHPEALDILKEYLEVFPDKINCQTSTGLTALHLACANSNFFSTERTVELLFNHPAINVNLPDKGGWSALHYACALSNTDSTERTVELLLLNSTVDVNLQTNHGITALHLLCDNSDTKELIKLLLLNSTVDVNLQTNHGLSALHLVCKYNRTEIVQMLLVKNI